MKKPKPAKHTFEPDVDDPQTLQTLAAQQRRFLAANQPEWVDVDLPEHSQREDIERALEQKAKSKSLTESNERFRELIKKRRAERLTEAEHVELIQLTDQAELMQVERLEALVELARLRNTTLRELMDALGIKPPPAE